VLVPDVLGNITTADDVARSPDEVLEEGILLGGQRDVLVVHPDPPASCIHRERTHGEPFR